MAEGEVDGVEAGAMKGGRVKQNDTKPLKNNLSQNNNNNLSQSAGYSKFIFAEKLYIFGSPFEKVVI